MASVIEALTALGCVASVAGEPDTAKSYAEAVVFHSGSRPSWTTVKAKLVELSRNEEINVFRHKIQELVENVAKAKGYDSGVSLASYTSSQVPSWALEANVFVSWRDAVWLYTYKELDKVNKGSRPPPRIDEFLAELPSITWPN